MAGSEGEEGRGLVWGILDLYEKMCGIRVCHDVYLLHGCNYPTGPLMSHAVSRMGK